MSDYYDRLQEQLMQATARPLPRARPAPMSLGRPRGDHFAIAAALAVAAAVAAIFFSLGSSARHVQQLAAQTGLAVVHNHVNGVLPALGGSPECETKLLPARVDRTWGATPYYCYVTHVTRPAGALPRAGASGTAIVSIKQPFGEVFSIDVSGLPRSPPGGNYAVWLLSGRQNLAGDYSLISGIRPTLVGIVGPPVGASGRLRAQGSIPTLSEQQATGSYLFAVTRQARPSNTSPGRIVLAGWMSF